MKKRIYEILEIAAPRDAASHIFIYSSQTEQFSRLFRRSIHISHVLKNTRAELLRFTAYLNVPFSKRGIIRPVLSI